MKQYRHLLLLLAVFMFCACGKNSEYEFSDNHTYFTFHNETHQNSILASAMNQQSPGVFCIIRYAFNSGRHSFLFENNQGLKSDTPVWFDGIDLRLESWKRVGLNNGLIVGYGNLDTPAIFYAYDLQCPNCFQPQVLPLRSYELTLSSDGFATCNNCHRRYNMNTGGNIIEGETGKKLTRYRANTTGAFGVLGIM